MKRRAFKLVMLLLLGAIVNVAVAWGLGVFTNPDSLQCVVTEGLTEPGPDYHHWSVFKQEHFHATRITSSWFGGQLMNFHFIGERPAQSAESLVPAWAQQLTPYRPPSDAIECATAWEYGWPARSMGGIGIARHRSTLVEPSADIPERVMPDQMETYWASGLSLVMLKNPSSARPLVFEPLWPGFAINTIFYALILWLLFTSRLVLPRYRRIRRIKRGLCPACAYPVGGSPVCTECGAAVAIRGITRR